MYIGWQHRIFPYAPFDAFVEGLEKLGSSYVLKVQTMHVGGITCCSIKLFCSYTVTVQLNHRLHTTPAMNVQMELRELRSEVLKVLEKPQQVKPSYVR